MQNQTFLKPKPDKCPAFSFSTIQTLSSFYQLLQPKAPPLPAHPTFRPTVKTPYPQTNRDLLPQNRDFLPQGHGKDHFSLLQNADHQPPQRSPSLDPRQSIQRTKTYHTHHSHKPTYIYRRGITL